MAHGWLDVSGPGEPSRLVPCPECAPVVQARRTQGRLARALVGQVPAYAAGWTWETLAAMPGVDLLAAARARGFANPIVAPQHAPADAQRGLYLYGRMGRGKTGMAVCILADAREAGCSVGYISLVDYFRALRNITGGRADPRLADEYERLRDEVDVLVLDDLGAERATGFVLEELYGLIEARAAREGRWTVITSNYDLRDLIETWMQARGATEADRVACARIKQRLRRHFELVEVQGADLCRAGSPAAADDEEGADDDQ